jgi:hypothetical protein
MSLDGGRPPMWPTGQSSWLQIQRLEFDSRRYNIFWEVVGLERSPLSLASTTEELLERKSSCSVLENLKYGRRDRSRWPRGTLYPQKLTLTSPSSRGRSVGIVCSRIQVTEFFFMEISRFTSLQLLFFGVGHQHKLDSKLGLPQSRFGSDDEEHLFRMEIRPYITYSQGFSIKGILFYVNITLLCINNRLRKTHT